MKKITYSFLFILFLLMPITVVFGDDDEVQENGALSPIAIIEGEFYPPIDMKNMMTERFGSVEHPSGYGTRWHNGIDVGCYIGEPVYAIESGTIKVAEPNGNYGNYVLVEHGSNLKTVYAHLFDYNVVAGQSVKKADVIGYCGNTGWSTGKHLHFELHINNARVDPEAYFSYTRSSIVTPNNYGG